MRPSSGTGPEGWTVLVDFSVHLPTIPNKPPIPLPWRSLVSRLDKDLPPLVKAAIPTHSDEIARIEATLQQVLKQWLAVPAPACEGTDGFLGNPSPALPHASARLLSDAFDDLLVVLNQCLPTAQRATNRRSCRVADAWSQCLAELRLLRRSLLDSIPLTRGRPVDLNRFLLDVPRKLWEEALSLSELPSRRGNVRNPLPDWDAFHSNPEVWATQLGFQPPVTALALLSSDASAQHLPPSQSPTPVTWDSLPDRACAAPASCLQLLVDWISEAGRLQSRLSAQHFASLRQKRLQLLRSGNVKAWAARMRPASNPTLRYTPPWVQDPDGTRRRPSSSEDVLQGAVQEWSRLLKETPINWQNEAVLPFSSALLPRRTAIHFAALGVAAPDSSLALLGKTLIEAGLWRLVPLRPGAVFFCDSNIFLNGWLLTARDGSWWATRPEPCPGQPYLVLSCSDIPAVTSCRTISVGRPQMPCCASAYWKSRATIS